MPDKLIFSSRSMAIDRSRYGQRWPATLLLLLTLYHMIYMHLIAGESPVWFNAMFFLQRAVLAPYTGLLPATTISLIFIVWAVLSAVLIWSAASRLAALLWLVVALWEIYFRIQQLLFILHEGFVVGLPMQLGLAGAAVSLAGALLAVFATFRYHRYWSGYSKVIP
jgi:hypothetical protein